MQRTHAKEIYLEGFIFTSFMAVKRWRIDPKISYDTFKNVVNKNKSFLNYKINDSIFIYLFIIYLLIYLFIIIIDHP